MTNLQLCQVPVTLAAPTKPLAPIAPGCRPLPFTCTGATSRLLWGPQRHDSRPRNTWTRAEQSSAPVADADAIEVELKIEGMVCGNCSDRVQQALQKVENVKAVTVSHETGLASIEVQVQNLSDAWNEMPKLAKVVNDQGFEATPHFGDPEEN